ncbi:hypothetical protein Taro_020913 [Colocasia esculenta]|uniref:Uncharacterized protein n=1 Tax=Colocasia esculenta TaxID=4460 RepID=A0A843V6P0_COLES|nr:hypothetical protein [Colocasia esculenta]
MGREGGSNPTAVHSSIALLQERFRQLQRVKEMREERELLRACTEPDRPSPSGCGHEPKWFLHPDLVHPSRPLHGPKSFRPDSGGQQAEFPASSTSLSMAWNGRSSSIRSSYGSDEMDVDTSLHL